jgi:2-hydroxychromene-2-carboxylate isomerase
VSPISAAEPIDFWFSIGSLYTFLTVMRLDEVAAARGVSFRWRPFSVRAIMQEMNNDPSSQPGKLAYAFRDLERRAAMYGFPLPAKPPYPLANFDLANRLAVLGAREGWCAAYVRAAYRLWFLGGKPAGDEPNVSASLRAAGQDAERAVARARSSEIGRAYAAATDAARALGVFGVPSFTVGRELFWGDDRLEDAIAWRAAGGTSAAPAATGGR